MPELPEVDTVRRGLAPVLEQAVIARVALRRPDLRFPFPPHFAERLAGRRVLALRRRGKYLLADLDDGAMLLMHLGMSGSWRIEGKERDRSAPVLPRRAKSAAHDHVVVHLRGGTRLVYNDPRRFGFMFLLAPGEAERHPLLAHLGPEPTGNAFSGAVLAERLAGRTTSLKAALSDQSVVAGLGNIYACEALWRARLSPRLAAGSLVGRGGRPMLRLERLVQAIRAVLAEAVEAGGSSLRDHVGADGTLGRFQASFSVYGREGEPCLRPRCGGQIRRIVQSGRSTFYCPRCQR